MLKLLVVSMFMADLPYVKVVVTGEEVVGGNSVVTELSPCIDMKSTGGTSIVA